MIKENKFGNLDTIIFTKNNQEIEVSLYGANLLRWKSLNKERLYIAKTSLLDGTKAVRGGVPVVFPQFARPNENLPQHGFVRTSFWKYLKNTEENEGDEDSIFFYLDHTMVNDQNLILNHWNYAFNLLIEFKLTSSNKLIQKFYIQNIDNNKSFFFQNLLHTYYSISNIHNITVKGLKSSSYLDKLDWNHGKKVEEQEEIIFKSEFDSIYLNTKLKEIVLYDNCKELCFEDARGLELKEEDFLSNNGEENNRVLTLTSDINYYNLSSATLQNISLSSLSNILNSNEKIKKDYDELDTVVWNAWHDKAASMSDLLHYQGYVCLEPGLASTPQNLEPGELCVMEQTITAIH